MNKFRKWLPFGLAFSPGVFLSAARIDLSDAIIVAPTERTIMAKASDMLRDEIEKRTRIGLEVTAIPPEADRAAILLGTAKELSEKSFSPPAGLKVPSAPDGYALWIDHRSRKEATVCLAGYDDRGTLFAAGKLLRLLAMGRDRIAIEDNLAVETAPRYALRGHQLGYRPKTNSYDGWTVPMWEQYFRDLVVFGTNAIELIPPRSDDDADSPHFPKPQMEMMEAMSGLAKDYGLDVWIWFPALEKDYRDRKTVEAALEEWGEVFRRLPKINAVFVPGGDPGNTPPSVLMPFLEKEKENLNRYHPNAQIWVSPQGFDRTGKHREGWLQVFLDILQKEEPAWLDGVVFGPQVEMPLPELRQAIPASYPIRRYPDITHSKRCQYRVPNWDPAYRNTEGREPINPRPRAFAKIFRDLQDYAIGFITYSEGCNDDVNKIVWSSLGWDPESRVEDILRDYSRYFIGEGYEETYARDLLDLEANWEGPLRDNEKVYATLARFQEMEGKAGPREKLNWRFQEGLYRAYYDAYIKARLAYETDLEIQAREILRTAPRIGSLEAMEGAEAILHKAEAEKIRPELRARVFELAEALFQSVRLQLSVPKYQARSVNRAANLDLIDVPLNASRQWKEMFRQIRGLNSEKDRLIEIRAIANGNYERKSYDWEDIIEAEIRTGHP